MSVSVGASTKVRAIEQGNSQSNSRVVMFLHDRIGFGLFVESSSFRTPESYRSNNLDVPLEDEMLRTIKAKIAHMSVVTIVPWVVVISSKVDSISQIRKSCSATGGLSYFELVEISRPSHFTSLFRVFPPSSGLRQ